MIKATDLMIGNYVNEYILGDVCVNEIYENSVSVLAKHMDINKVVSDIAYTISCSNLIGIPLTPDVLERLGFEKRDNGGTIDYHIGFNEITHDWLFFITWPKGYEYPFYRNGKHQIKYVHTIQNLYKALTGKDLTFKTT